MGVTRRWVFLGVAVCAVLAVGATTCSGAATPSSATKHDAQRLMEAEMGLAPGSLTNEELECIAALESVRGLRTESDVSERSESSTKSAEVAGRALGECVPVGASRRIVESALESDDSLSPIVRTCIADVLVPIVEKYGWSALTSEGTSEEDSDRLLGALAACGPSPSRSVAATS